MKISDDGLELIKKFEGLRLAVYEDVVGKKTIGYGHLIKDGENFDDGIDQDQADNILRQDAEIAERCTTNLVRCAISQKEFDALCSFVFNLGCRALQSSTLLRYINTGDMEAAAQEFLKWDHAGHQKITGLTNRRIAERGLFLGLA